MLELYKALEEGDPFGTVHGPEKFICPATSDQLIDYPSIYDQGRVREFKEGKEGTWIMYQHLRKAGGTGFCDLATVLTMHESTIQIRLFDNFVNDCHFFIV